MNLNLMDDDFLVSVSDLFASVSDLFASLPPSQRRSLALVSGCVSDGG